MDTPKKPSMFKRVFAAIFDFLTIFIGGGWVIASMTGDTTENGFSLNGAPALVLFALVIAYFVIGRKYLGGTPWQYILGARS